ncbi:MAG: hypothetical protein WAO08_32940 [Hyphomicrobiaceae bacterium]
MSVPQSLNTMEGLFKRAGPWAIVYGTVLGGLLGSVGLITGGLFGYVS